MMETTFSFKETALDIEKQLHVASKKVKKTCQSCAKSKVICSSSLPKCSRCIERGYCCIYTEEMKRGRKEHLTSMMKRGIIEVNSTQNNDNDEENFSNNDHESNNDENNEIDDINLKKRKLYEILPESNKKHAIVNGAPVIGSSIEEIIENSKKIGNEVWLLVERLNNENPIKVGSRGYSKRQKKIKDENPDKQNNYSSEHQSSIKNTSKIAKIETIPCISSNSKSNSPPTISSLTTTSQSDYKNISIPAPSIKQFPPLSRNEINEAERKIFISYFDILKHTSSSASVCSVTENLKVFPEKMARFIASTSQIERFNNIFNESIKNNQSMNGYSDCFQSCQKCISLDTENDSFDRFSCIPSASHISAVHTYDMLCASYLQKISNISSNELYLQLDYFSQPDMTTFDNRKIGSTQAYANGSFTSTLGYTSNDILQLQHHLLGTILPFGGDAFALLFNDANDIKRILHRFAMKTSKSFSLYKMQASGFPSACFTIETLFSVGNTTNPLYLRRRFDATIIPCICQILSRSIILQDGLYGGTQLHMNIIPIEIHSTNKKNISTTPSKKVSEDQLWIDHFIYSMSEKNTPILPSSPIISSETAKLTNINFDDLEQQILDGSDDKFII